MRRLATLGEVVACTDAPCETYPQHNDRLAHDPPTTAPRPIDPQRELGRQLVCQDRVRRMHPAQPSCPTMPGVTRIRSYVSGTDGKIYCECDAPDAESIREHARRAALPVDRIAQLTLEISLAMFR